MAGTTVLLVFLLILSIGIGIILYVSKSMRNFWVMAGWALFTYLCFAFLTLLCIMHITPAG